MHIPFNLPYLTDKEVIRSNRKQLWDKYYELLKSLVKEDRNHMPDISDYVTNSAYMVLLGLQQLAGTFRFA